MCIQAHMFIYIHILTNKNKNVIIKKEDEKREKPTLLYLVRKDFSGTARQEKVPSRKGKGLLGKAARMFCLPNSSKT